MTGLLMIIFVIPILVFCYTNVFFTYNSILLRKQKRPAKAATALSENSKKLLYKLCVLTANFVITFIPLVASFVVMMATEAEINDTMEAVVLLNFEIGLFLNPLLIYLLDAKMKLAVNELFGIRRNSLQTVPKKKEQADQIKLKDLPPPIAAPIAPTAPTASIVHDTVIEDTQKIPIAIAIKNNTQKI